MTPMDQSAPSREQIADGDRQLAATDASRRSYVAENTIRELKHSGIRFAWLVASPTVLGAALLIFVVLGWGAFDLIGSSGTTTTALIVGALLVLVPAVLAAWQRQTAIEHAQQIFEQAESVVNPPERDSR